MNGYLQNIFNILYVSSYVHLNVCHNFGKNFIKSRDVMNKSCHMYHQRLQPRLLYVFQQSICTFSTLILTSLYTYNFYIHSRQVWFYFYSGFGYLSDFLLIIYTRTNFLIFFKNRITNVQTFTKK